MNYFSLVCFFLCVIFPYLHCSLHFALFWITILMTLFSPINKTKRFESGFTTFLGIFNLAVLLILISYSVSSSFMFTSLACPPHPSFSFKYPSLVSPWIDNASLVLPLPWRFLLLMKLVPFYHTKLHALLTTSSTPLASCLPVSASLCILLPSSTIDLRYIQLHLFTVHYNVQDYKQVTLHSSRLCL